MKSLNVRCGFDENFFKIFKDQLLLLPELARNGVIAFDEMKVRDAIDVNVKMMTFDGFLDYTNDNNSLKNKCDGNDINNQRDYATKDLFFVWCTSFYQMHKK